MFHIFLHTLNLCLFVFFLACSNYLSLSISIYVTISLSLSSFISLALSLNLPPSLSQFFILSIFIPFFITLSPSLFVYLSLSLFQTLVSKSMIVLMVVPQVPKPQSVVLANSVWQDLTLAALLLVLVNKVIHKIFWSKCRMRECVMLICTKDFFIVWW